MTEKEVQEKALDLYNALVEYKSSGLFMKFKEGWTMEVVIAQDLTFSPVTPLFNKDGGINE